MLKRLDLNKSPHVEMFEMFETGRRLEMLEMLNMAERQVQTFETGRCR
jgi:hypothetical protein